MVAPQGTCALLPNLVGFGISEPTVENVRNHEHGVEDRYKLLARPDVLCPQRQGQEVLRPLSSLRPCDLELHNALCGPRNASGRTAAFVCKVLAVVQIECANAD